MNTSTSLFLPKLSAVQEDAEAFARMSLLAIEISLWLGLLAAAALAIFGPALILGLFGDRYAPGMAVLVVLGAGQAVRIARCGPNAIAMATGWTGSLFWTGLVRAAALPVAYVALTHGRGVVTMSLIVLVFELAAFATGLWLVAKVRPVPVLRPLPAYAAFLGILVLILFDLGRNPPVDSILGNIHPLQAVIALAAAGSVLSMPQIRRDGLALLRQRRRAA